MKITIFYKIAVIKLSEWTERNGWSIKGRVYWILKEVLLKHAFYGIIILQKLTVAYVIFIFKI